MKQCNVNKCKAACCCAIYDRRPQICRIFGTGTHPGLQCRYLKPKG